MNSAIRSAHINGRYIDACRRRAINIIIETACIPAGQSPEIFTAGIVGDIIITELFIGLDSFDRILPPINPCFILERLPRGIFKIEECLGILIRK